MPSAGPRRSRKKKGKTAVVARSLPRSMRNSGGTISWQKCEMPCATLTTPIVVASPFNGVGAGVWVWVPCVWVPVWLPALVMSVSSASESSEVMLDAFHRSPFLVMPTMKPIDRFTPASFCRFEVAST